MALVLLAIAAVLQEPDARRRRRHLAGAVAVAVVASHLHAGAVNAYLFLLVAAAGVALEALRARLLRTSPAGAAGRGVALELVGATLVALAISAATLALYNPHGVRVLTVPFLMANDAYQAQHLVEFRPPTRFPVNLLGSYWLLVAVTVGLVVAQIRHVHLAWLLLFAMTLVLSLRHVRLAYDFALVAVVVSAATLASTTGEAPPRLSAAVLLVACVAGPMHHWSRVPRGLGWAEGTRPTALFDVLRRGRPLRARVPDPTGGPPSTSGSLRRGNASSSTCASRPTRPRSPRRCTSTPATGCRGGASTSTASAWRSCS